MNYTLHVGQDARKVWVVTSPDIKGLLVVSKDPSDALGQVPQAIDDLQMAKSKQQ